MHRLAAFLLALSPLSVVAQDLPESWVGARSVQPDEPPGAVTSFGLTRNDLHWLRKAYPNEPTVALRAVASSVRHKDREATAAVVGCTENINQLCGIATTEGRFLRPGDLKSSDSVAVVNQPLAAKLNAAVSDHVVVGRTYYKIVGICKPPRVQLISIKRLAGNTGGKGTPTLYLPITTMKSRMGDVHVSRKQGSFEADEFQISEIWIANASAVRMRTILQSLRTEDQRRGDYHVGETVRAARQ